MKQQIERLLHLALKKLESLGELPAIPAFVEVMPTKNKQHGDFASNIAMILAKLVDKEAYQLAERIIEVLPSSPDIQKIEIRKPGFINFFLSLSKLQEVIKHILTEKEMHGRSKIGRGKRILVEFLSSNPTGPLHVGHGRHAAFGAAVSNLLDAIGFKTYREYYINDFGKQMDRLTISIWLRYLILFDETIPFPAKAYSGDYISEMAHMIRQENDDAFYVTGNFLFEKGLASQNGDEEKYIDALILYAKNSLGDKYKLLYQIALKYLLKDIKEDLVEFGIRFDNWVSEYQSVSKDIVEQVIVKFKENGFTYEKNGAVWFRATHFGGKKDRVLIRSNGVRTYFANDVAYHLTKFDRGFDIAIDIFGPDHQHYAVSLKAAMEASHIDSERLVPLLVQFVSLYRGKKRLQMSTREGHFITLRQLRKIVGNDAARFFYVMYRNEQYIDFDLELARAKCNDNPVYYIQYAHARICSVFKQLEEKGWVYDEMNGISHRFLLSQPEERNLLNQLSLYHDKVVRAALAYEPHQLACYLRELANLFHIYYQQHSFLIEEISLRNARLALISATKQIFLNGLNLLGISSPNCMRR